MSCIFQYTTEPRDDGKRKANCVRCGQPSGWTLSPLHEIHAACRLDTNGKPLGYPGNELKALLTEWGYATAEGCGCDDKAALMNAWGVSGCKANRAEIIAWLHDAATTKGWLAKLAAGVGAGWLVDQAIARATARLPSKTTEPLSAPLQ